MEEATMSGTDDDLLPLGQPPQNPNHHRRHLRYATPEASTPPPPHFILEAAMSSQHPRSPPPPNAHRSPRNMSSSPPPPPAIIASPSGTNHPSSLPPASQVEGQDHDRMETDEEDEDSESGPEADTPEAGSSEGGPVAAGTISPPIHENAPPPRDDEVMDTSPDNPATDERPPTPPQTSIDILTNEATGESTALRLVHVQMPTSDVDAAQVVETVNAAGQANTPEERETRLRAAEREPAALGDMRRADRARQERRREGREERHAEDDGERDDDSDESEDEEEHLLWANLKEDTSAPDERELKIIEENVEEVSALDHEYWEKKAFEALDDPEYVPSEGHRITWTVTGVHGTPEKPNREKIMRSPSEFIDGYYWYIKYYPHGNDGTEQLSIYIECSPTPWEELEAAAKKAEVPKEGSNADQGPSGAADAEQGETSNPPPPPPAADEPASSISVNDAPSAPEKDMEATPTSPKESKPKEEEPWGIAAQISCVIYNPDEPRVNASQKGCHRYYNDNPDWGWTRFHGPWDEIHKRQRYQRQALLRNDTLAFTAYIRTIKDDTKALWWHPPKDKSEWDCLAMTGVRAFECHYSSAMIAALSSWLHLSPVVDLIRNMQIPDPVWEAKLRQRPAFEELQDILDADEHISSKEQQELYLSSFLNILNFYGAGIDSKMDVVMIWETLRRILNYEASGLNTVAECDSPNNNKLNDVLLLKQPDPFNHDNSSVKYQPSPRHDQLEIHDSEPHSVQETIDLAGLELSRAFRLWRSFAGESQIHVESPPVLQIELHRQSYFSNLRKWKKLTHRIEMNENIIFNSHEYVLYGMIVHSGDLESKEYYSVIRPEGPGTRWVKYGGDNSPRKVEIMTTKKAVQAHEGSGDSADGTAAVAYIAMYVRKNMLSSVLCTPFKHRRGPKMSTDEAQVPSALEADGLLESKDTEETMLERMPVCIYSSELFQHYTGRGLCEPWAEQNGAEWVKEFKFAPKTKLDEIRKALVEVEGLGQNIRLWPMNTLAPSRKAYPELLSFETHKSESLEELVNRTGGSRFWLIPGEADPVVATATPTPRLLTQEDFAQVDEEAARRSALMSAIRASEAAIDQVSQAVTSGDDTEMAEATEAIRQNAQNVDAPGMEEALAAAQAHARLLLQQRSEAQSSEPAPVKKTYFLLKVFDTESQSLRGVCGHLAKSEAKIVEEVKKLLKVDAQEPWDLFHERGLEIRPKDQVKQNATFETEFDGADGNIIIAQRHLTAAQLAVLEAEGKCTNPIDYFQYLHGHDNPTYFQTHITSSYFGRPYSSRSLSMGRPHGHGTLITLAGDAYTGNFTAGDKSGQGTMAYANGDTYTGEWKTNEPNGQGQMVYAKTGNVYTGGFKKRKRHGKGHMVFEVADEEMYLCKICYEGEMDALFYDCGHVVACEECARQVDQCPVCRRNVRAVVRIWRT